MQTEIRDQQAIDVHAHFGNSISRKSELLDRLTTGDASVVVHRAALARTRLTVVSPLLAFFPRFHGDAVAGNREAARVVAENEILRQWVVVNPLVPETYDQAAQMLRNPRCVGIKIHPEEHGYPITEYGERLFTFAAGQSAVVITHSGEKNSLPSDFVTFANAFPEVRLILAHLGCGWDDDPGHQVRAILKSKQGNLYVDTSSARNVIPGLLEWAVREIGADRILYGTDSPLYYAPMQRARVEHAEIPDDQKVRILHDNARAVLKKL